MNYHIHRILISLWIAASSLLVGCRNPVDDTSTYYESHYELNVVTADGNSHWILADSVYVPPALTDSSVIFGDYGLWKVKYDGSNLTRLFPGVSWTDRSFSPREDKILLSSAVGSDGLNELYLLDARSTNLVKLGPKLGRYGFPRISPDLDEIVFTIDSCIARIKSDGSGFQYIRTKTNTTYCTFALYVDDAHFLYFENASSITRIWLHNRFSGEESYVGPCSTVYRPRGRMVVDSSLVLADGRIKIYNLFGVQVRDVGRGGSATFSSDGSKVVGSDSKTVFIVNSDGTGEHIVFAETDPKKSMIGPPQFSPDDKLVVFTEYWTTR